MKQEVYHQIWRPAPSDAYCLAQNYAVGMLELCGGYSQCENQLRRVLSRDVPRQEPRRALLPLLRQITFELQENLRCIRKASGFSTVRRPGAADFAGLEAPMRLFQYRCRLVQEGLELAPFAALAQNPPRMEPWYLERAGVLFTPPALAQYATVDNLIAASFGRSSAPRATASSRAAATRARERATIPPRAFLPSRRRPGSRRSSTARSRW